MGGQAGMRAMEQDDEQVERIIPVYIYRSSGVGGRGGLGEVFGVERMGGKSGMSMVG